MSFVHAGLLSRQFEQLCRIQHMQLRSVVESVRGAYRLVSSSIPKAGGVYAFWWTGSLDDLRGASRSLVLYGPGGRDVTVEFDDEWLGIDANLPIPLYVGKTADDLSSRIGQHLRLGSPERDISSEGDRKHKAATTSSQLRSGIEHLFRADEAPLERLLTNVGLSYVILDGDEKAATRFYLEDLAIGAMRPPINVDVER